MKIVLYQPDIAQNLGAAMRLCACFGVSLEIIEPCGFPLTSKALRRTAMDYGVTDTLIRHKSWESFVNVEESEGNRIVLLTTKAAKPITDFTFTAKDTLLFGRESQGVPENVHDRSDARLYIPIVKDARSFNLVSSASMALFEGLRQTGGLPE
ncbi:MAG: rRNA methyltransferase [Robiginitomaculum sp.]|nr:MAG: rRNA methyltransferase [Robiginitomaculum sp.]